MSDVTVAGEPTSPPSRRKTLTFYLCALGVFPLLGIFAAWICLAFTQNFLGGLLLLVGVPAVLAAVLGRVLEIGRPERRASAFASGVVAVVAAVAFVIWALSHANFG
jgi:hypothetical protein